MTEQQPRRYRPEHALYDRRRLIINIGAATGLALGLGALGVAQAYHSESEQPHDTFTTPERVSDFATGTVHKIRAMQKDAAIVAKKDSFTSSNGTENLTLSAIHQGEGAQLLDVSAQLNAQTGEPQEVKFSFKEISDRGSSDSMYTFTREGEQWIFSGSETAPTYHNRVLASTNPDTQVSGSSVKPLTDKVFTKAATSAEAIMNAMGRIQ